MKYIFMFLIRMYQRTLSLDHGPLRKLFPHGYCRFTPSCSEYSYQAINKHGAFWGLALGFWRIMRCNPWNPGGKDEVPETVRFRSKLK